MPTKKEQFHIYPEPFFEGRPRVSGVTIDNKDTRDMDDGIFIKPLKNGGYNIQISIADTSAVITPGSEIDQRAFGQAFTLYRPRHNKPMLPASMDHNKLSLVESYLRPTLTVEIELDSDLNVAERKIYRSTFQNLRKTTYSEVQHEVNKGTDDLLNQWSDLSFRLLNKRREEGALAFYDTAKGIVVDEDGNIQRLKKANHKGYILVQEMMILANRVVAEFMDENNIPTLFRNHAADRSFDNIGENLIYGIKEAIDTDNEGALANIQKSLHLWFQRARYEPEKKGHFGLQLPAYLHFTSPIRRYADLVVHRNLVDFLEGRQPTYSHERLKEIGRHLNERTDAEKDHEKSESYRALLRPRLKKSFTENTSPDEFAKKRENDIRFMLKIAYEDGIENDVFKQDVINRLSSTDINVRTLAVIIIENKSDEPFWLDLKNVALDHLYANPSKALALLEQVIRDYDEFENYRTQSRSMKGGFIDFPTVTISGEPKTAPVIPICNNKQSAKAKAAFAFWQSYKSGTLVNPENVAFSRDTNLIKTEERAMTTPENTLRSPVALLNEAAQKMRFDINYEESKSGPPHRPTFKTTITLSGGPVLKIRLRRQVQAINQNLAVR